MKVNNKKHNRYLNPKTSPNRLLKTMIPLSALRSLNNRYLILSNQIKIEDNLVILILTLMLNKNWMKYMPILKKR